MREREGSWENEWEDESRLKYNQEASHLAQRKVLNGKGLQGRSQNLMETFKVKNTNV